jgi:putative hydrolase
MPLMSMPGPHGGGSNPFEGIFGELARMLGSSTGPLNWDVARQVATLIASENQSEPNVDPLERIKLEELVRLAEMHVNQIPGLSVVVRTFEVASHTEWANAALDAYREPLEKLAAALGRSNEEASPSDPQQMANPMGDITKWMSPVLLGMQAGGMVGHLARRCLGRFDLPIPRPTNDSFVLTAPNIEEFSSSWSLPLDELSLYVATEELTRVAVFEHAHVRTRFSSLINEYVSGFQADDASLEDRFGQLDINDPTNLPNALNDPEALLGAIQTPQQQQTLIHLRALVAVFVGYVDYTTGRIAAKTISSGSSIAEAAKRRRVEETDGQRLVERLFGLELSQAQYDRGEAFINGVLERCKGDEEILARLWTNEAELPTPAEVDAPGLWLARIGVDFG